MSRFRCRRQLEKRVLEDPRRTGVLPHGRGMPELLVTVVVPTLAADARLQECVAALEKQTQHDFEVIVVDNSGSGAVRRNGAARPSVRVIEEPRNVGFGGAINDACRQSRSRYLATLNDDAAPHPGWLSALVSAMEARPDAGMCASQVRLGYGQPVGER